MCLWHSLDVFLHYSLEVFSFFFFHLLMLSLLSHPLRLLRKELLGSTILREAGCRRGPERQQRSRFGNDVAYSSPGMFNAAGRPEPSWGC